jgi:hypothetical protein
MADRNEAKLCFGDGFTPPDDLGHFIEHEDFTVPWKERGFTDDDFCAVQAITLLDAANTEPIPDTGGFRCLRFRASNRQIRFWYLYFPEHSTVFFTAAETDELDEELTDIDKALLRERAKETEEELRTPRKL